MCVSVCVLAICQEWAEFVMRVCQGRQQYLRVCMYVCVYVSVCVRVCTCVCVSVCVLAV